MPAILCPRCRKLISSEAPECPFCGLRRPGRPGVGTGLRRLTARLDVTRSIVYLCAAVYGLALLSDPAAIMAPRGFLGLLAPSPRASLMWGMTGSSLLRAGHWWTLITAIYLHGGLLHIFFNMMWVRQLGPLVEEVYGPLRLWVIFTVAGVCGFLFSCSMGHALTLGASGAIFGLLAAAIEYGRRAGALLFTRQLLQWALILFVFGLVFPGIDNWAHAGGFLGGYGTAFILGRFPRREEWGSQLAAGACLALTLAAFVLQAVTVISWL